MLVNFREIRPPWELEGGHLHRLPWIQGDHAATWGSVGLVHGDSSGGCGGDGEHGDHYLVVFAMTRLYWSSQRLSLFPILFP